LKLRERPLSSNEMQADGLIFEYVEGFLTR